ncbi:MAG: hypothetical protein AB7S61_08630 [Methanoregulaceae archaeon]
MSISLDAPIYVDDLARSRARGYAMAGNRCAIVTDRPANLVEVHPPSRGSFDFTGFAVEQTLPAPVRAMVSITVRVKEQWT